jgi:hypothetical protein
MKLIDYFEKDPRYKSIISDILFRLSCRLAGYYPDLLKTLTPLEQFQKIRESGYNIAVIICCPDHLQFEQEIIDNLMIKDIIQ